MVKGIEIGRYGDRQVIRSEARRSAQGSSTARIRTAIP
jgi:hypothetical protein